MAKKNKAKKISFRQRLRNQSAERLEKITNAVAGAAARVCEEAGVKISHYDVMRLLCASQIKTLREQLITELANETETELEAIYNKQMTLLEEAPGGDKKEN